jgi:hypothetical protein
VQKSFLSLSQKNLDINSIDIDIEAILINFLEKKINIGIPDCHRFFLRLKGLRTNFVSSFSIRRSEKEFLSLRKNLAKLQKINDKNKGFSENR